MKSVFVFTSTQKVLDYLANHPGEQFLAGEIQNKLKISKGGINQSLRKLAKTGLIYREKKGKIFIYSLNHASPIIKQYKILKNTELIYPLVNKLKDKAEKVVLFGSSSRGEDVSNSDLDLFILTKTPEAVRAVVEKPNNMKRKIQTIIRTPVTFMNMEKKEPVFFEEIYKGIVIWEIKE